jgi:hypothetical protein
MNNYNYRQKPVGDIAKKKKKKKKKLTAAKLIQQTMPT